MIGVRSVVLLLIAALLVLGASIGASFALDNYQLQVVTSLAMLCVLCWAWNIVGGYMGYPALSTATFFGVGAYVCAITQTKGLTIFLAWGSACASGAVLALLLGIPLLRLKGHYFAIGSIATVEVFREIANNWDFMTGGAVGLNLPILEGSPEAVGRFFFIAMVTLAAIAFAITLLVERTRFGFALRCIRQNEQAAAMVGIDVVWYKVCAFVLSGALAAIAGGIYASMVGFIEPKDAFSLVTSIEVPVMTMLGGMGTLLGPLLGGIFYVVLKEFVWANFINWHSAFLGIIIVGMIYFLPVGVLGLRLPRFKRARPSLPAGSVKASVEARG